MILRVAYGDRQKTILRLLAMHGPLSSRILRSFISPTIREEPLRRILKNLVNKEILQKRFDRHFNGSGTFYQLSQTVDGITKACSMLGVSPALLKQPHFRSRDLLHSQSCAVWTHHLKSLYPNSIIIRDFEFEKSELANRILISTIKNDDMNPDLLVILPVERGRNALHISVEIERSLKSRSRLISKLKKYSSKSYVDGVLYVVNQAFLVDYLKSLYRNQVLATARRINHYGNYFLMFTMDELTHSKERLKLLGTNGDTLALETWVDTLRDKAPNYRRNKHFELRRVSPPKIDATP